jgi:hypothetical protein
LATSTIALTFLRIGHDALFRGAQASWMDPGDAVAEHLLLRARCQERRSRGGRLGNVTLGVR